MPLFLSMNHDRKGHMMPSIGHWQYHADVDPGEKVDFSGIMYLVYVNLHYSRLSIYTT